MINERKRSKSSVIYGKWTSYSENIQYFIRLRIYRNWGKIGIGVVIARIWSRLSMSKGRITLRCENFELKHMNFEKTKTIDQLELENRL